MYTPHSQHPERLRIAARVCAAVGLVLVCGCASKDEFVPVAGKVVLEGKPLRSGNVSLRPDESRGNHSLHIPTGTIDAHGNYEIYTAGKRGAPPGWYRVVVFADNFSADAPPPMVGTAEIPKSLVHERYLHETTTPLKVEVVEKPAEDAYLLKLTR